MEVHNRIKRETLLMNEDRFERITFFASLLFAFVFLFLPIFYIGFFLNTENSAEDYTVIASSAYGIVAVTRTIMRRILTASASNIARLNLAFFSRTIGRAVLRRLLRLTIRILARTFFVSIKKNTNISRVGKRKETERRRRLFPLALGSIVLSISLAGVLLGNDSAIYNKIIIDGGYEFYWLYFSLSASAPLIVYGIASIVIAKKMNIDLRINTALDGVILQIYFTMAGSFLPLTTDFEYKGKSYDRMRVSLYSLSIMYGCYILLYFLYLLSSEIIFSFLSFMFLLNCFVVSFPLKPFEGHYVWRESRLLWMCVWLVIIFSYSFTVPEDFFSII